MAAGTVISGGFPGRVAQEVQPNPKCNGCLHYDGQAGRTGACTIGLRPWNCGDGDAADIGYAPLSRGAGTYLPGMSNRSAQAPEVGKFDLPELYGAASHRPVTFQQVSLGEEHVHFAKSLVSQHTSMQKSMCRLCQSTGMIGMAPANVGPQICTCAPIEAYVVAKALASKLSNLERTVIDLDDLTAFVYDAAQAGFNPRMMKGTFYHAHGKYEVSAAGGGSQHVDFHPRGGGPSARVGTYGSHREARRASETHARRFAAGTGTEHGGAPMPSGPSESSGKKTVANKVPKKNITFSGAHAGTTGANPVSIGKGDGDAPVAGGYQPMPKKTSDAGDQGRVSMRGVAQAQAQAKPPKPAPAPAPKAPQVAQKSLDGDDWLAKSDGWDPLAKGPRGKMVATAPEVPTTEKPYQTRFKRPNDAPKQESPKSSGFNIDTSKLRAAGERHAGKLMTHNAPRGTDDHGAKMGREAFASRTPRTPPQTATAPSPNRPGQNRPDFGGDGPKPAAPKQSAPQVAAKPATPKHIDMEEGMSEASKRVRPIAQVPSMSTMPKKEEREMPRVSYKSLDEIISDIEAITKGGDEDEIDKAIDHSKHSHIVTGKLAPNGRGASSKQSASRMVDKLDNQYGGYGHTVKPNPSYKPANAGTPTADWKAKYPSGKVATSFGKALDDLLAELHNEEDVEKSLRWSHKTSGEASTSHGKYTVHHDAATGHHVVTYKPKGSDKGSQAKFKSHREALGALVEHHIKNRPPPKPRKKKDPNAPKAPKGAGGGPCPPCP